MNVSPIKNKIDQVGIRISGFEKLKRRIKQRYVRQHYIKQGEKLVAAIERATRDIEREFGDIVISIYVVGKTAQGQVNDNFIDLIIIMKQVFGSFMLATHGVFVEKVFEPILLEAMEKDEGVPFIYEPLYFTVEDMLHPFPARKMMEVVEDVKQNGILIYGVDVFNENGSTGVF
jgi:hypothetical protein